MAAKSNSEPILVVEKTGKRDRDVLTQTLSVEKKPLRTSVVLCSIFQGSHSDPGVIE